MEGFVNRLVNTTHTLPRNGVLFWYDWYMRYLADIGFTGTELDDSEIWQERLCHWSRSQEGRGRDAFSHHMRWENDNPQDGPCGKLVSFRFVFGLRNFVTPNDHRDTAEFVRKVAASEPSLRAYSYNYFWQFADQYAIIKPNTIQNVLIALAVMVSSFYSCACAFLIVPSVVVCFCTTNHQKSSVRGCTPFSFRISVS